MKILYGANNNAGSNTMLKRFIENSPQHSIRAMGYYKNSDCLRTIDWCLDALYQTSVGDKNYFMLNHGIKGPHINHEMADTVINDLVDWEPDLVISECEPFSAMIAKALEVPLWYCSPMLQLTGIEMSPKDINSRLFDKSKQKILGLPKGDRYLVYSPLCDIAGRPFLKEGYEYVRPYSKNPTETSLVDVSDIERCIPSSHLLCTGEISLLSDCLYSEKTFWITPSPKEEEQVLNAQLFETYGVAKNIGRPNSLLFIQKLVENPIKAKLSLQSWKMLDEML